MNPSEWVLLAGLLVTLGGFASIVWAIESDNKDIENSKGGDLNV
jgi:hypothetical protein